MKGFQNKRRFLSLLFLLLFCNFILKLESRSNISSVPSLFLCLAPCLITLQQPGGPGRQLQGEEPQARPGQAQDIYGGNKSGQWPFKKPLLAAPWL